MPIILMGLDSAICLALPAFGNPLGTSSVARCTGMEEDHHNYQQAGLTCPIYGPDTPGNTHLGRFIGSSQANHSFDVQINGETLRTR